MTKWMAGAALALVVATPAAAQIEGRVGKLEAEMRAVQRKVFPGGAGAMVEPQIAPTTAPVDAAGVPATSALTDITARVTSLEQQMASMTGQIEQTQYKLRQLEQQFEDYRKATDARLAPPAAPAPAPGFGGEGGPAVTVPQAPVPAGAVAAAGDTAAIDRPSSGDPAEDAYLAGYRLWQAKDYPAAEAQLKKVVATYPKHRRASFAQNLLGRSYLDEGKPSLASIAFYDNYKKFPDGERAPDSLYYLGTALLKLDKPADACKVYGELTDVYGSKISPGLKADVAKARTAAKCK
ncbi:YbgF trimerization domain-containing protein [Sphingomonas sp. BK235]|uniref:YbgF trimerization domain-containing protein n=1 Tax=Sphingomonas sp. BK235 TaxID=2512131 RepID=UPI0010475064|nr:YbgF trimerization domain-containing protein [Sphingomonas sp. BK235]